MNKKLIILLIAVVCIAAPATAGPLTDADISVGLFVGDNTSATVRMDVSRNTAWVVNFGWGYGRGLYLRPQYQLTIDDLQFQIQGLRFYPYIGAAAPLGLTKGFDLAADAVLGISYYFYDIPMEIYVESLLGLKVFQGGNIKVGPDFGGGIGVRYALGR